MDELDMIKKARADIFTHFMKEAGLKVSQASPTRLVDADGEVYSLTEADRERITKDDSFAILNPEKVLNGVYQ